MQRSGRSVRSAHGIPGMSATADGRRAWCLVWLIGMVTSDGFTPDSSVKPPWFGRCQRTMVLYCEFYTTKQVKHSFNGSLKGRV